MIQGWPIRAGIAPAALLQHFLVAKEAPPAEVGEPRFYQTAAGRTDAIPQAGEGQVCATDHHAAPGRTGEQAKNIFPDLSPRNVVMFWQRSSKRPGDREREKPNDLNGINGAAGVN